MNAIEAQRVLWVSTSCGSIVLRMTMRVAQPMRVKQKVYTNDHDHKENGSPNIINGDHQSRRSDKQSPEKRKAPLLDSIPGISHGCKLSTYEVA